MGVFHNGVLLCPCHAPSFLRLRNLFSPYEEGLNFMARFLHSIDSFTIRKYDKYILALSWISGLGFGALVFRYAGSDFASQMPLAATSQPSIFGLLTSSVLPFLFSAFAVYICAPRLLFGICFVKAFILAYVSCGVFSAFGSGSWLVFRMLLFTDLCCTVLLYLYWLRHISGVRGFSFPRLAGYLTAVFLTAWVDIACISPQLRMFLS